MTEAASGIGSVSIPVTRRTRDCVRPTATATWSTTSWARRTPTAGSPRRSSTSAATRWRSRGPWATCRRSSTTWWRRRPPLVATRPGGFRAEAEHRYRQQRQNALVGFLTPTLICWVIWSADHVRRVPVAGDRDGRDRREVLPARPDAARTPPPPSSATSRRRSASGSRPRRRTQSSESLEQGSTPDDDGSHEA